MRIRILPINLNERALQALEAKGDLMEKVKDTAKGRIATLVYTISDLPANLQDALTRVCEARYNAEVYLSAAERDGLVGLIDLTPGRMSAKQDNKFAVAYDAKCTSTADCRVAWNLWMLGKVKSPDFEEKVRRGYYNANGYDTFEADLRVFALESGIPERYADKVCKYVCQEGHAHGASEILNVMWSMIEFFK